MSTKPVGRHCRATRRLRGAAASPKGQLGQRVRSSPTRAASRCAAAVAITCSRPFSSNRHRKKFPGLARRDRPGPRKNSTLTPEKNDPLTLVLNPIRTLRGSLTTAPPRGALRSPQARQKTENEIAEALGGWQCFMAVPTAEAENLRKRWPNVEETEMLALKRKYAP